MEIGRIACVGRRVNEGGGVGRLELSVIRVIIGRRKDMRGWVGRVEACLVWIGSRSHCAMFKRRLLYPLRVA